jgi:putative cell wall-binding protein
MARPSRRRGRAPIALLAATATGLSGVALLGPATGSASSHREAPYTAGDPRIDNTDVYAFVSPDKADSVTLVANFYPFQEPDGGPNFYRFDDEAQYNVNIDNNGDALADVVYRWTFDSTYRNPDTFLYNVGQVTTLDDPDLNFRQTYDLQVINAGVATTLLDNAPVAPSNVGPASMPNYAALRNEAVRSIGAQGVGGQGFAGQADDPFFLDLRIFDLLYGGNLSEVGNDTLNGRNVQSLALQVPKTVLAQAGNATNNPVIGVWSTTERRQTRVLNAAGNGVTPGPNTSVDTAATESGDFVQVSRLGNPLVNEVVIPVKDKDRFNNSTPDRDAQFLPYVQDPEVPRLIESIYKIKAPDTDAATAGTQRSDLISVFLTGVKDVNNLDVNQGVTTSAPAEYLRLNMGVAPTARPNRLGVIAGDNAGFPNGRRLSDDVVDIALQVLEGELVGTPNDLGDAVSSNDLPFSGTFPYVALPHNSAVNQSQFTGLSRLAGGDRYGTAAAIARATFTQSDTVLLASGLERNLPDALAGNYLAGLQNAPILLTTPGSMPAVTRQAIVALGAKRVIILGGPSAVSEAQAATLRGTYAVERVGGRDRYETAALIATRPQAAGVVAQKTAIVARGDVFPDALVSGPISYRANYPILLTRPGGIDSSTANALRTLGIDNVIIAGGTQAVSATAETQIKGARGTTAVAVRRFAGADRMATATAMATFATSELSFGFARTHANLARGDMMVDAVAGGPHAGREGSVILLTANPNTLGTATAAYLAAESITLEGGHVFGGPAAVSDAVIAAATDAANSNDATKSVSKR